MRREPPVLPSWPNNYKFRERERALASGRLTGLPAIPPLPPPRLHFPFLCSTSLAPPPLLPSSSMFCFPAASMSYLFVFYCVLLLSPFAFLSLFLYSCSNPFLIFHSSSSLFSPCCGSSIKCSHTYLHLFSFINSVTCVEATRETGVRKAEGTG